MHETLQRLLHSTFCSRLYWILISTSQNESEMQCLNLHNSRIKSTRGFTVAVVCLPSDTFALLLYSLWAARCCLCMTTEATPTSGWSTSPRRLHFQTASLCRTERPGWRGTTRTATWPASTTSSTCSRRWALTTEDSPRIFTQSSVFKLKHTQKTPSNMLFVFFACFQRQIFYFYPFPKVHFLHVTSIPICTHTCAR